MFEYCNGQKYLMRTDLSRAMGMARHNTFASRIAYSGVSDDPDFAFHFSESQGYGKNGRWGLTLRGVLYFLCRSNELDKAMFEVFVSEIIQ